MSVAWSDTVYQFLKAENINLVSFVPDAGHSALIKLCEGDSEIKSVRLTSEEEGVSLSLGAWLGGRKSVVLMQSSGVGNIINMLSILKVCQSPLLMLVTMRGEWGEFNPWQVPMGQATRTVLEKMGVLSYTAQSDEDVIQSVEAAAGIAFNTYCPSAVLISQRLLGAKAFDTCK